MKTFIAIFTITLILILGFWAIRYSMDQHMLQCQRAGYTYDQCLILLRYYY